MHIADALFMPFIVNELVLSVNPVKLYEYIYSGKPCLAARYPESEKFKDFAYLYQGDEEFGALISRLEAGTLEPRKSLKDCRDFAMENTWDVRYSKIKDILACAKKNEPAARSWTQESL